MIGSQYSADIEKFTQNSSELKATRVFKQHIWDAFVAVWQFFFILYSSPFEFQTDYSSTCDQIRWPLPQNIENIWTHRNSSGKHFYSIWMRTPKRKSEQCIKYTRGETSFVLRIARLAAAAAVVCFFFLFRKNAQCNHFLIEYIFQHLLNIQLFHSLMEWASKCGWSDAREHTLTFTSCTQMFHCLSRPYVYTNDKYANSTTILSTIRKQRKKKTLFTIESESYLNESWIFFI